MSVDTRRKIICFGISGLLVVALVVGIYLAAKGFGKPEEKISAVDPALTARSLAMNLGNPEYSTCPGFSTGPAYSTCPANPAM
jgi:hypothetical protein